MAGDLVAGADPDTARGTNQPILVIDSGIGGLLVAGAFRDGIPGRDLVVVADHAGAPYGPLSQAALIDRLSDVVDEQLWREPSAVVVACNTATLSAISTLRGRLDLPFVGFEPAVKPASLQSARRSIGVLATAGSLAAERFRWLCETYAPDARVTSVAAPELVELVERDAPSSERRDTVARCVQAFIDAGVDTVALGCTHFSYLRAELELALGPDVALLDPTPAVISRTQQLLGPTDPAREAVTLIVDTDPSRQQETQARWDALRGAGSAARP